MRILVANDDGIESEGIKTLAKVLSKRHKVTIVAPDGNRSAFSHSLTISKNLIFKEVKVSDDFDAYTVSGTPADCVKFALHYFTDEKFDMVCSGINMGNNLGSDIMYSGTVAAAVEANFLGLKSIAFSNTGRKDFDFSANAAVIEKISDVVLFEYFEYSSVILVVLVGVFEFVSHRAERRSGGVFKREQFFFVLFAYIEKVLVQNAFYAVMSA